MQHTLLMVTEVFSANGIYTSGGTSDYLNHIKSYSEENILFPFQLSSKPLDSLGKRSYLMVFHLLQFLFVFCLLVCFLQKETSPKTQSYPQATPSNQDSITLFWFHLFIFTIYHLLELSEADLSLLEHYNLSPVNIYSSKTHKKCADLNENNKNDGCLPCQAKFMLVGSE